MSSSAAGLDPHQCRWKIRCGSGPQRSARCLKMNKGTEQTGTFTQFVKESRQAVPFIPPSPSSPFITLHHPFIHLHPPPSRMVHWAQSIGPHTARLFDRILADKPHPEMGYRSCLGLIRLAGQYSSSRMEAAAEGALATGACRYQSVKSILKNSLDAVPQVEPPPSSPPPPHDNIRGADYFD